MSHFYRALLCFFMLLLNVSATNHPVKPLVIYIHETIYSTQKEYLTKLCDFPILLKPFSGADLLGKVLWGREKLKADVIWGLEGEQAFNEKVVGIAMDLPHDLYDTLSLPFKWESRRFLPISYAYLAFLYDMRSVEPDLKTSEAFLKSLPNKSTVIPDPRTSMVGRGGVSWIEPQHYGLLHQKVRTYPKGWSGAFALFEARKVSVMLGYSTSVLLHHNKGQGSIKAALFKEGAHPIQVMTAFLVKKKDRHPKAMAFLKILLSSEMQKTAFHHYSYAVTDIKVPAAYEALRPENAFVSQGFSQEHLKAWMAAGYQ